MGLGEDVNADCTYARTRIYIHCVWHLYTHIYIVYGTHRAWYGMPQHPSDATIGCYNPYPTPPGNGCSRLCSTLLFDQHWGS